MCLEAPGMIEHILAVVAVAAFSQPDVRFERLPDNGRQARAAVASDGTVHVVFLVGEPAASDVMHMSRAPGEAEFAAPVRVNSQPGSAVMAGTMRGAQIALGPDGWIHVAWNGSQIAEPTGPGHSDDHPHAGLPVLYSRSRDGLAFEPQRGLMRRTEMLDGGCSVAADGAGNVHVIWHASAAGGDDGEADRSVWVATSRDDGATFAPERDVLPERLGACGCCGLAAGVDERGRLFVLYRAATEGVERGMYLLTSPDGNAFHAKRVDEWSIQMCPASSTLVTRGGEWMILAWENRDQVYWAWADESIEPVAPPGDDARRKHPSVARAGGHVLLAWAEGGGWGKEATLAWQAFTRDGEPVRNTGGREPGLPAFSFPCVVPEGDGFIVLY